MIKAIVFGATGMVGEGVLHESLKHNAVESVLVVGRRPCDVQHAKLREVVHGDLFDVSVIGENFTGYNACFFCLGISSIGVNEKDYRTVTYDLTMGVATILAKLNPDMTFCYVSGLGTDNTERGRSMWARVKGKTENDLMKVGFKATYSFRPGYIRPTKGLKRSLVIAKVLVPIYPLLATVFAKYVCTLQDVGLAMISVSRNGYHKHILECEDITQIAKSTNRD
ncbi:MAG: NAD-dependent epimerase/dehydratase family protein [Ignavibacteriales bacterium]|nr:NAD-dependent epimerase/dehydratase family protein [Ignavibacteriales bacterium]